MFELTPSQRRALEYINDYAKTYKDQSQVIINHILKMSNISHDIFDYAIKNLKENMQIALHFHPDRLNSSMITVTEALLEEGIYRNQFETLISNGKVSPEPGGTRDLWENRIFGGAYQMNESTSNERPKYGALNIMLNNDGPSPRFGSCYFLLSPQVSNRSTFSYLDSHQEPFERGTYDEFGMILAALLEDAFSNESALGERNIRPPKLIEHLLVHFKQESKPFINTKSSRNLNHYIEAQVHGNVFLKDDVDALVADPSFKETEIGTYLEKICAKYSIDLHWHSGFIMKVDDVPLNFRGPSMPSLAKRIAQNDTIHAYALGRAVKDLHHHPERWKDRGTFEEVLQELKLLWHVLVRYGQPYNSKNNMES